VIIARGAEGILKKEKFLGLDAVVKDRVKKGYRQPELDARLRKARTKMEAKLLHGAKLAGVLCPVVYATSGSELIVSLIEGNSLRELLRENKAEDISANQILKLTGEALAKMHSAGIVHGDFTTANVLVSSGKPWIIDFGLGQFCDEEEEKAYDLLIMKRALAKKQLAPFLSGYSSYVDAKRIEKKLAEIESRGRYVVRSMVK